MDPDHLASEEASLSNSTPFTYIFKRVYVLFQHSKALGYKLICSFGQIKFSLDKYSMIIYLCLGKYKVLLFPHPCP